MCTVKLLHFLTLSFQVHKIVANVICIPSTGCIKMFGAVFKLIIFTSMVNRITYTSRNERVTEQVCDTYLQMFDVCTLRHTAHIEAIVQFLPYSAQQVRCDGLHSRGNSVLQIRYVHRLWWHKHFVLHVTTKEVVTRGYIMGPCRPHPWPALVELLFHFY